MALTSQQLAAGASFGRGFARLVLPEAGGSSVAEILRVIAGGGYPVVILTDPPVSPSIPQLTISLTAQSRVQLANLALVKLGVDPIDSFDDDVKAASKLTLIYDRILDQELSRNAWTFAVKRDRIGASSDQVEGWGAFKYTYPLPPDFLTLARVSDEVWGTSFGSIQGLDEGEYQIEGQAIRSSLRPPLPILYVARILDTTKYHPLFVEALASRLAKELAIDLTKSTKLWQKAAGEYDEAIKEARRINAIHKPPRRNADDSWLLARM